MSDRSRDVGTRAFRNNLDDHEVRITTLESGAGGSDADLSFWVNGLQSAAPVEGEQPLPVNLYEANANGEDPELGEEGTFYEPQVYEGQTVGFINAGLFVAQPGSIFAAQFRIPSSDSVVGKVNVALDILRQMQLVEGERAGSPDIFRAEITIEEGLAVVKKTTIATDLSGTQFEEQEVPDPLVEPYEGYSFEMHGDLLLCRFRVTPADVARSGEFDIHGSLETLAADGADQDEFVAASRLITH